MMIKITTMNLQIQLNLKKLSKNLKRLKQSWMS